MASTSNSTSVLQDFQINVKLKISALWIAVMFCYVYADYIELHVPGILAEAMQVKSEMTEIQIGFFIVALLMVIPSTMIFFTLILKPKVNRLLNMILPICYIILLFVGILETTWAFYLFFSIIEIILSITIFYYAWKWPKTIV